MIFKTKFFDELSARELYEIVRARQEIFLMEQGIICRDFDGIDYNSLYCCLFEGEKVVAYLRAYRGDDGRVHIGRVLSIRHKEGLGRRLMELSIPVIKERLQCEQITLHSQKHAEGFYLKLGFVTESDVFMEEGIPHVRMIL